MKSWIPVDRNRGFDSHDFAFNCGEDAPQPLSRTCSFPPARSPVFPSSHRSYSLTGKRIRSFHRRAFPPAPVGSPPPGVSLRPSPGKSRERNQADATSSGPARRGGRSIWIFPFISYMMKGAMVRKYRFSMVCACGMPSGDASILIILWGRTWPGSAIF